jgi:carbon monoxide dehydrogenase subunit G
MKLEHQFTVPAAIDDAWQVLLDVERIAPCMPGAALTGVEGDEFTGTVKVKVGPIQVTYRGQAKFTEKNAAAHRVVIEASGKESRGAGTAAATITALLSPAGPDRTTVQVETDLNVTGKPAQFGRGVMADVGAKLVGQFADCLAEELAGGSAAPSAAAEADSTAVLAAATATSGEASSTSPGSSEPAPDPSTDPEPQPAAPSATTPAAASTLLVGANGFARPTPLPPRKAAEPIDLLDVAGASVAKRVAPIAAAVGALLLLLLRRRRHRRS